MRSKPKEAAINFIRNGSVSWVAFTIIRPSIARGNPRQANGEVIEALDTLRRQHDQAEEIAACIVAALASYAHEYDAIPIARNIGKLNALLRVHLAYEDMVLYPLMMRSRDREVSTLACQFHQEMGQLAPNFEEFARRWSGPTIIATMFETFREEAVALLAGLAARIERENDLLYPLAQAMRDDLAA